MGITSACAEQTSFQHDITLGSWDHLRVCGADLDWIPKYPSTSGSPPRVRSRRPVHVDERAEHGITSACAEQTVVFYCVLSQLNGVEYLIYALRRVS